MITIKHSDLDRVTGVTGTPRGIGGLDGGGGVMGNVMDSPAPPATSVHGP